MRPAFIASLGNPGAQYANTLHSSGHTLLSALVKHANAGPLGRSAAYKGASSTLGDVVFWQSPSYMNTSGPPLAQAWRRFSSEMRSRNEEPQLIILHDELELPLGKFKVRAEAGSSARGHNGLKSVLAQQDMKKQHIVRVGIGIGPRPENRDSDSVAKFVLRRMNSDEVDRVGWLAPAVWKALQEESNAVK